MESEESVPIDTNVIDSEMNFLEKKGIDTNKLILSINAIALVAILIVASLQIFVLDSSQISEENNSNDSNSVSITWGDSQYLPRHPECVDDSNGQDLPEYGIGYEPSISITSNGNMFITCLLYTSPSPRD